MVKFNEETKQYEYFDKYGQPIYNGDYLLMDGKQQRIYQTDRDIKHLERMLQIRSGYCTGRAEYLAEYEGYSLIKGYQVAEKEWERKEDG